jgi:hypothetical protein
MCDGAFEPSISVRLTPHWLLPADSFHDFPLILEETTVQ